MKRPTRLLVAAGISLGLVAGATTPVIASAAPMVASSVTTKGTTLYVDAAEFGWTLQVKPTGDGATVRVQDGASRRAVPANWLLIDGGWYSKIGTTPDPNRDLGTRQLSYQQAQGFIREFRAQPHNFGNETVWDTPAAWYAFYDREVAKSDAQFAAGYAKEQRIKATKSDTVKYTAAVYGYIRKHHQTHTKQDFVKASRAITASKLYRGSVKVTGKWYRVNMGDGPFWDYTVYVTVRNSTDRVAYQGFANLGNPPELGKKIRY